MSDCIGRYARLDEPILNGAGQCIAKGTRVKIVGYGRGLIIQTEQCPCCKQSSYIRSVTKDLLTLEEE